MPRTKKITITEDQAEDLEQLMGDYLIEPGPLSYEEADDIYNVTSATDLKRTLRSMKLPAKAIRALFSRLESIGGDINNMQMNHEVSRDIIDTVSEELKSMDELLGKLFNVKRARRTKKPYTWTVWS